MKIQQDQKAIISPEVLFQEVSGEIVLLDLASESYFGLDEIGARIWALLNEEKTVGQIVGVLLDWATGNPGLISHPKRVSAAGKARGWTMTRRFCACCSWSRSHNRPKSLTNY